MGKERIVLQKAIYFASNSLKLQECLYNLHVFYTQSFPSPKAHRSTTELIVIGHETAACCPRSDVMPQFHCHMGLLHTEWVATVKRYLLKVNISLV